MKNIKCNKCGHEFDSNMIKCPECGHNRFVDYIIVAGKSIMITALLVLSVISLVLVTSVNQKLDTLQTDVTSIKSVITGGSSQSSESYSIEQDAYYQGRELSGDVDLSTLEDDYILYFHQYDCSACKALNMYVKSFIEYGAVEDCPIYFVTPDSSQPLFNNTMFGEHGVQSTPQMFRMSKDQIKASAEGVDACVDLMDNVVNDYE